VLEVAGPRAISLRLSDALYADGPLLAWLKYRKGIDALVSLPEDRLLYQDLQGLAQGQLIDWTHHRYVRTIQGHKQLRAVEVTAAGDLRSWDGFTEAAARYGVPDASLWACLIRDVTTQETATEPPRALVSTRHFADGFAALQAFRPRWHIEDDAYRELKEGWGLEQQRWGRDVAAALGRTTLTCLAFNTAQVYRRPRRGAAGCDGDSSTAPTPAARAGPSSGGALCGWLLWRLLLGRVARRAGCCPPGESPACLSQAAFS